MKLKSEGFKRYWHPDHKSAIAFKKGTWIGFDDPDGAKVKCEYVVEQGLNGAMFWTLDMDDFSGKFCNNGSFPVIRAVSDCFKKAMIKTTTTTTITTTIPNKSSKPNVVMDENYNSSPSERVVITFNILLLNILALFFKQCL